MAPKDDPDNRGFDDQRRPSQRSTVLAIPALAVNDPKVDPKIASDLPSNYIDDDEDAPKLYTPSFFEKVLNYALCRGDIANQQLEAQPVSIPGLFRYGKKFDWLLLFIGTICAIISGVSQPILALVSGRVTNALLVYPPTSKQFRNKANENVYIFLGIGIFISITNFIQYMCFQHCCTRVMAQMRHRFVYSVLRQNAGWFDKNHSGTITTKLNDSMERIREGIGDKLGVLLRGFAMLIAAIVVAYIYEWRLASMMLGVAPTCCICMSLLARQMTSTTIKELIGVGKAGSIAEESLMGVRTVQAFNGQEEMVGRYEAELEKGRKFAVWKGFWSGFFGGLFFLCLFSFLGCGMLYGAYLLRVGIITTPGDVFIVVMSMLLGAYFLGLISPHMMVLLNARVSAATIYQTIDRVPKIDPYSKAGKRLPNVIGRVKFENVHFRYPSRKDAKILNGLNLTVEPGTSVALVGHSGCGKSTSVGLLTRLYEPEAGNVTIDGTDVRELNIDWLRNIVGIVQQEPILFNDTIHNNLLIGSPGATREKMIEVCKMANAHDFIEKMPKGYDTLIGDGGVQLSGGQKQRVAIARTLIRDPKILLLDEATSALDAQSESVVQSALNNAAKGRTTIMIAHRLSTIREADKIVFFEKGVIVEAGNHEELVHLGGRYFDLVKAQQFKADPEATEDFEEEEISLDDTSRSSRRSSMTSARSGSDAFQRGNSLNDSFSGSKRSARADAENDAFAAHEAEIMAHDGEITAGYLDIFRNAKGNYLYMFFGTVFALIRGLELPALALIFGWVFEGFTFVPYGGRMMHRMAMAVIAFASVGVGVWISQVISSVLFAVVSENLSMRFRVQSFRNLLYQDASYFDNPAHAPGKLITRLASDAPNIKAVVDARMLQVIYALAAIIANIVIAFIYCWQIGILGTSLIILLAFVMIGLAYKISLMNIEQIKNDEAGRIAIEIIENVKTIQLLTRSELFFDHYQTASKQQKRSELKKGMIEAVNYSLSQSFMYFMMCFTYAVGIRIIYQGDKSPDDTFKGIIAMMLGAVAVMNSAQYFPEFVKAKTAAGMLFNIIYRKPRTGDLMEGDRPEIRGNILFENVKFSYPQRPLQPIMKGLQWTALRGQTVALVGPSGSGKSTNIGMLERFYDVTDGVLRIDGQDIRNLSLYHLRTQMALVGQEPRLFAGTIRENVCLGLKDVPLEKINQALELANANRFLANLPAGIDTDVGEKGGQLSGGQKQRIAIARALVRDPKILLLDEATSALDSESERAVQEALDRAREGRTCITIAHRLSSIQNSDLIVYIDKGKVQEAGNHSQLMQKKGRYYKLIKKQDLAV
ncbi:CRE-PGP-14 protein [Caenorhabditis remanei]|uniref:CRE-PGP-14 protein n=4 Tax=Caenorhabditis remanei TaxID=31234 RepID=E3MVN4_CAERE|nr:CRE-PGP-14 protein [Caenorhabditis remanei]